MTELCPNRLRVAAELKACYAQGVPYGVREFEEAEVFAEPIPSVIEPISSATAAPTKDDLEYGSLSSLIDFDDDVDVVEIRESGRQKQVAQVVSVLVTVAIAVSMYALVVAFSHVHAAIAGTNRGPILELDSPATDVEVDAISDVLR